MSKNKTITLNAQVAISKTESGMDYVQVLPDNARVGLVQPFHGVRYGQMRSNGSFDFVRRKRIRKKPELKVDYGGLSFCNDGFDRVFFIVPAEMRADLPKVLNKGIKEIIKYLREQKYSL